VRPSSAVHACETGLGQPFPISTYAGEVVRLGMNCPAEPQSVEVTLGAYSPVDNPLGSAFFLPAEGEPLVSPQIVGQRMYHVSGGPQLEVVDIADAVTINCVAPPTPTPTATPLPAPRMQKLPALQNLFLTRQGTKIPPLTCTAGADVATLSEAINIPISGLDPKDPSQPQQLGGFSFQVKYDPTRVCVELAPGPPWTQNPQQICTVEDAVTAPALQGIARIHCVTLGKATTVDTSNPAGRVLATIEVRPQPEAYSQIKPNQDNGQAIQINDEGCKLTDLQGHAITLLSCDDAAVTTRFLEGDVEPDCQVNALDTQAIAFRRGASKGSQIYLDRFNLEPSGTQADQDIDINDLQFVYGRFGSMSASPWPDQPPVNPKA
jgi:hypothetical protein